MSAGLGYLDSNNIWQFGEDDAETLMSDLLNKGQIKTSEAFTEDRARLDEVELPVETNMQVDTTNSIVRARTDFGFGRIQGPGASLAEAVTFSVPFAGVPAVSVSYIGSNLAALFDHAGASLSAADIVWANGEKATATGFTVYLGIKAGSFSTNYFYYSWQATGPVTT